MSAFTRTSRRIAQGAVISALGVAVAMGTTACSAGKISQTNNMEAAINGANGTLVLDDVDHAGKQTVNVGSIGVRNLHIIYPAVKAADIYGDGGPFQIGFSVVNDSNVRKVRLTGITPVKGKVEFLTTASDGTVTRAASPGNAGLIAPNGALVAGFPSNVDPEVAAKDGIKRLDVELTGAGDTVAAGLTTPLTLTFEVVDLLGNSLGNQSITVQTPVDASAINERGDVVRDIQSESGN